MPVLAGTVAMLLFIPLFWFLPSLREHAGFVVAALLAIGLGVGAGIRSGQQSAGQ